MAEPTDYFLQGANLGMRAMQAGAEMHKFRTNLAERARQFNEGMDLQRDQVNAAVARDNAYVKKLEFDLKTQSDAFNRETIELDKLDKFTAQINKEYTENAPSLSLPPSGLTGERFEMAMSVREAAYAAQQRSLEYQAISQDRADEMDLIRNYGLPANWKDYGDDGASLMQASRDRRSMMEADVIASKYGTTPADVIQADPSVSSIHLYDHRGNLNKALWEGVVQRVTGRMQTSRATSQSGSTQYSINPTSKGAQTNTQRDVRDNIKLATDMATIESGFDGEPDYVDTELRDEWIKYLNEPDKYPRPTRAPRKSGPDDEFSRNIDAIMNQSRSLNSGETAAVSGGSTGNNPKATRQKSASGSVYPQMLPMRNGQLGY